MKLIISRSYCSAIVAIFALFLLVPRAHAQEPKTLYQLGVLAPLTGNYAVLGEDVKCVVIAATQDGAQLLRPSFGDSRGEAGAAVAEYQKLARSRELLAMYVQRSTAGMAVNALSFRDGIPLFGGVGHPLFTQKNEFAWQFWISSDEEGGALADAAIKRGYRSVAAITVEDEWSVTVSNGFRKRYKELGGKIAIDEFVLPTDTDIKPLLLRMRNANPSAVLLNLGIHQLGVAIKQMREVRFTAPILSTFWAATPDVIHSAAGHADGVLFVEMRSNYPHFTQVCAPCFKNRAPTSVAFATYAAVKFLQQALRKHPLITSSRELQAVLLEEKAVVLPDVILPIRNRQVLFPSALKVVGGDSAKEVT